jgi:hypothetical protein
MVFLARKDGKVIHHTDRDAMKQMDGIDEPELEVPDRAFEAAGGLARIINGEIFIGKTEAEKQAEGNQQRITALKRLLSDTDYIAVKIAEGAANKDEYTEEIAQRAAWRTEIQALA